MHVSAKANGQAFFNAYSRVFPDQSRILEIGSQIVGELGGLRDVAPGRFEYVGLDCIGGNGVDVVMSNPYSFPIEDASADLILCSSCFEHSEFFWLVFLEAIRCLRPGGLFYLNVPSAGQFHRYPADCWRFYPDSGHALAHWGQYNGYDVCLLESFIQVGGSWQDAVSVFLKDTSTIARYPRRILHEKTDIENGYIHGHQEMINYSPQTQNDMAIARMRDMLAKP